LGERVTVAAHLLDILWLIQHELMLFAAAGFILFGLDDLVIDLIYISRRIYQYLFIYSRHPRMTSASLPDPKRPGTLAIFLPAWDEASIIASTLTAMLKTWQGQDFRLFVGVYPNDRATIQAAAQVAATSDKIQLVITGRPGPTTKADCLNWLWAAMLRDEKARAQEYKAIILHDAEDVVHRDELRLFDVMVERFDMVQLPVKPMIRQTSQWISGHYADEFAEAHGKFMKTREAMGASIPSAGVGCAFARHRLAAMSDQRRSAAFDARSLTEDYEVGLRLINAGAKSAFIRMRDSEGHLICTQEYFPDTLRAATRQKGRWLAGISLAGWDRMGWHGGLIEHWMRLHDRRAMLTALVSLAAHISLFFLLLGALFGWTLEQSLPDIPNILKLCLYVTAWLGIWRLLFRAIFVWEAYGWRQGLMAIPRAFLGNIIGLIAAGRAIHVYQQQLRSGRVIWHKTDHRPAYSLGMAS
jgi:bacteriophage N4 adsorption protein B